ncbi:MAG: DUF4922 domain-containing protein [Nitrospirota bacterium]
MTDILLEKGTLWKEIVRRTEHALSAGALLSIPTEYEFIEDSGVRFFVRILSALKRKADARKQQEKESVSGKRVNPFLPYEKNLFVADISETHVALLNKFNVVEHHLLIVTKEFEDQETLLTPDDFDALWACMAEYNGLGFYNGGEAAGASQPHKHLQMVPLPLAPEGPQIPIDSLLLSADLKGDIGAIPGFPFLHIFARLGNNIVMSPPDAALRTFELYRDMLQRAGMNRTGGKTIQKQTGPYCLLVTRQWMLIVPRSREFFESVSINSLGFAGALLVWNDRQMEMLKSSGPMTALRSVAIPV